MTSQVILRKNTVIFWTNVVIFGTNLVIIRTNPAIFWKNPVILRTYPIIFRTNPVIFRTNPFIYRTIQSPYLPYLCNSVGVLIYRKSRSCKLLQMTHLVLAVIVNKPGVARAVLQTASLLINSVTD